MEYQIKAVFLFNFAQFVEWPSEAFANDSSKLYITILGTDPFGNYLDETVSGEYIGRHPIVIQRVKSIDKLENSHILFIKTKEVLGMDKILSTLNVRPVLTVSDISNFTKSGGMIEFVTIDNKIKLRINLESTERAHLVLNSRLLNIAEIVGTEKESN